MPSPQSPALVGLEGGQTGTGSARERGIVIGYFIADQRDIGRIGQQDSLEVCVADLESGDDYIGHARIWRRAHSVDPDTVREAAGIDDGIERR